MSVSECCMSCKYSAYAVTEEPCKTCEEGKYMWEPKAELKAHMTIREKLLEDAKEVVLHDREDIYGKPESNFENIAAMWNAYCYGPYETESFDGVDVALMMALLKITRAAHNKQSYDSYVDIAGYAACAAELAEKMRDEE